MILDYEEQNPEKFKDTTYESTVEASSIDEKNRVEYTEGYFKETLLKKKVVVCSLSELHITILGSLQLHDY